MVPNVLLIGTGEYVTGFVNGQASTSDKTAGVVALTFFDLRARNKVGKITLCGTNGAKFPALRAHLQNKIGRPYNLDVLCATFPPDDVSDAFAYQAALATMEKGDIVAITTPDDTHYAICLAAIRRGCHVICTKPIVKTLKEQQRLAKEAKEHNVIVGVEYHKRYDPMYQDAKLRAEKLGFNYFSSYMSQGKAQLDTFKKWAGLSSDISYYLNSHHVDICCWLVSNSNYRCVKVTASASQGIANAILYRKMEDTIVLMTEWVNPDIPSSLAVAVFTASWATPKADVHSQQRFHYMGPKGEIQVDQAHRGFQLCTDQAGLQSINPLYMRYTPKNGKFVGQQGYGYQSFAQFVQACKTGRVDAIPTLQSTFQQTAILEAGRRSLDLHRPITILWEDQPVGFE